MYAVFFVGTRNFEDRVTTNRLNCLSFYILVIEIIENSKYTVNEDVTYIIQKVLHLQRLQIKLNTYQELYLNLTTRHNLNHMEKGSSLTGCCSKSVLSKSRTENWYIVNYSVRYSLKRTLCIA